MNNGSAGRDRESLCIDACVHELFTRHAILAPERIALTTEAGDLTYGELNARADRLAEQLIEAGAVQNAAVGVFLERSAEFVIAVLAVLKAGCCYVPLDPDYPRTRLALMLRTAGVRLLVTRDGLADRLPDVGTPRVDVDPVASSPAPPGVPGPMLPVHTNDLAYIMFTSGSTGTPKGVAVPHAGLVRLVDDPGYVRLGPDEVLAALSSTSFDASTFEIWGALANGGRLVIGPPGKPSAGEIGDLLKREGVTCAWLTAGLFNLMVDERLEDLTGLRQLLSGGDIMSPGQARRFLTAVPDCVLINGYGPTEVTTFTACHTVTPEDTTGARIPVGKPIDGTWVEILDEDLAPVPPGATGLLYAGGAGLARGYVGDPGLTGDRFVPDPWSRGLRLYNTGDLAMYRPDGSIDFLGRADQQLKKRGFRIEPVEVEEALRADPVVRDAAVALEGGRSDEAVLVAYLVADPAADTAPLDTVAVRSRAGERLPEYMVPDRFFLVDAFPLTPNGKVDRVALAVASAAALDDAARTVSYGEPLTGTETELAAIWTEILEVPGIGRDSDFFELGGQSFQASRMAARMRTRMGVEVPLSVIFNYPTVAQLAELIDHAA